MMNDCRRFALALMFLLALTGAFVGSAKPARAQLGAVSRVSRTGNRLDIGLGRDALTVRVCTADMIQVVYQPDGKSTPETLCMTMVDWSPTAAKFDINSDPIVISTSAMTVTIRRSPCRIAVYDKAGRLLVKEQNAEGVSLGGLKLTGADGSHFFGIHGWEFLDKAGSQGELAPRSKPYPIRAGAEGNTGAPFVWNSWDCYGAAVNEEQTRAAPEMGGASIPTTSSSFTRRCPSPTATSETAKRGGIKTKAEIV